MTTHPSSSPNAEVQQQLEAAWRERDQAQESAHRWRRLYEVEAQQRQKEAEIAEATIKALRAEIQHLCHFSAQGAPLPISALGEALTPGASNSVDYLRHQIRDLMAERDQLVQSLAQERQKHAQTRENLISALGDALGVQQPRSLALSSRAGERAGAIILKDRNAKLL
ncbi:MAG: hypothetical protein HC940_11980 [Acaryochloris sp. SU_5_25]|nr:hypothetical protein [Acaryochloris sp. SU_5_25]